ncbi:gene transfer agent family protein [Roseibium sp.]|uniref:gene transfer agent family protein n=1 Tax=Roseibium sp. TaxID=1936156 RepID=UPI003267C3C3
MANHLRGEISACLDGRKWTLVLTLGALAELENAFSCDDLQALVERFSTGRFSARDLIRILGAGLRGAGNDVSDDQLALMTSAGGVSGYAAIAADLLRVTFGDAQEEELSMSSSKGEAGQNQTAPFPGAG